GHWRSLRLTVASSISNGIGLIRHYTGSIDTTSTGASVTSLRLFAQAVSGTGLVSWATNNGAYYRFIQETATLAAPPSTTSRACEQAGGYVATYRSTITVSAILTNAVSHAPIAGRAVTFTLGRSSRSATTDANGRATAGLPVLVAPDSPPPRVTVGFAEDQTLLGSGDRRDVTINPAPTLFIGTPTTLLSGSGAVVPALSVQPPAGNKPLREIGVRITLPDGRTLDTLTDGFGRVLLDTLDFEGLQPGTYATRLDFFGNDRYVPATLTLTQTVASNGNHSLALTGSGYAEAPHAPDVNLTGDWTLELWFKDEDPNGFDHDYVTLLNKG